jgi:hypothetical protein
MAWVGKIPNPLGFSALSETIGKVSSRSLTVEAKTALTTNGAIARFSGNGYVAVEGEYK